MRITPMPPTPAGVAIAAMVSALTPCSQPTGTLTSPLAFGRCLFEVAGDMPLLRNGQDVIDGPVEHQA